MSLKLPRFLVKQIWKVSLPILLSVFCGQVTFAASYQPYNTGPPGTELPPVDPILDIFGQPHPYDGPNLEAFVDATGADLSSAYLYLADLRSAILVDANLENAYLEFAEFRDANLRGASFDGAMMYGASARYANLDNVSLRSVNLELGVLGYGSMVNADLSDSNLSRVYFPNMEMPLSDLSRSNLEGASFELSNLHGAVLTEISGAGLRSFASDFSSADLSGANLVGAFLSNPDFSNANLRNVNFEDADFLETPDVTNADFSGAVLLNLSGLDRTVGSAFYDANTDFTGTGFDPVAAGWTLVPEPGAALLLSLGLAGLARRAN